jgi:hypothetical protein
MFRCIYCHGVQTVYSPVKATSRDRFVITRMLSTRSKPKMKMKGASTYVAGLIFFLSPLSFSADETSSLLFFAWSGDNPAAVLLVFVLDDEKGRDGFVAVMEE